MSFVASPATADRGPKLTLEGRGGPVACLLVVLLAFVVREYFVLVTVVDIPIRGDIREYVLYAWNLHYHHVFGLSPPDAPVAVPDAYRSPGYPWLLALCMAIRPSGFGWYALALQVQVLLGTLTVWLTILLARQWLAWGWAIAAGLLLTFWPHHVAATGALLSEVTFGFSLMAGLVLSGIALSRRSWSWALGAGVAFGYAYLVNPLIALFPPLLAWLLWRQVGRTASLCFGTVFLLAVAGFAIRNVQLPPPEHQVPGRAGVNFVQGSWPQYHAAWQSYVHGDPIGKAILDEIDDETRLVDARPLEGMRVIGRRLTRDPLYYGLWYLWEKPLLLWDWEIRLGPGGEYVLVVRQSPLERNPTLRLIGGLLHRLNPLISLVALAAMVGLAWRWRKASTGAQAIGFATAVLGLYLTLIHDVFQAEPRYANAYRGIELVMFVAGICCALSWIRGKTSGRVTHNVTK